MHFRHFLFIGLLLTMVACNAVDKQNTAVVNAETPESTTPEIPTNTYTNHKDYQIFSEYKLGNSRLLKNMFSFRELIKEEERIILFEKAFVDGQEMKYQLLDTIIINETYKDAVITFAACFEKKVLNDGIIVLVNPEIMEFKKRVIQSWYGNKTNGKFQDLPLSKLDCLNANKQAGH